MVMILLSAFQYSLHSLLLSNNRTEYHLILYQRQTETAMNGFQSSKTSRLGLILLFLLLLPTLVSSFLIQTGRTRCCSVRIFSPPLRLVDDDQEVIFGSSGVLDTADTSADSSLMKSLQNRQKTLKQGTGKRYVTRTQKGFLNVHYEPTDPHDTNNVVGNLEEGQIVTSTGPTRGSWVPHDGGGWSISKYGGFTWLEPIDE
jgi:hypothetical protein